MWRLDTIVEIECVMCSVVEPCAEGSMMHLEQICNDCYWKQRKERDAKRTQHDRRRPRR